MGATDREALFDLGNFGKAFEQRLELIDLTADLFCLCHESGCLDGLPLPYCLAGSIDKTIEPRILEFQAGG